jgi:hypothetical protein
MMESVALLLVFGTIEKKRRVREVAGEDQGVNWSINLILQMKSKRKGEKLRKGEEIPQTERICRWRVIFQKACELRVKRREACEFSVKYRNFSDE